VLTLLLFYVLCPYFISRIKLVGFSRYDFHRFENFAMVAPSMMR